MRSRLFVTFAIVVGLIAGASIEAADDFKERESVLHSLERGNLEKARRTAGNITQLEVLVGMRVDNRYARIVEELPKHFDIARSAEAIIEEKRVASEEKPRSLEAVLEYAHGLSNVLRFKDAFDVSSAALDKITSNKNKKAFDDVANYMAWLLNQHADALRGMGHWDEAVQFLSLGAGVRERGAANVSQSINLALIFAKMGRTKEAEDLLKKMGRELSGYGLTQVQLVKLIIAEQTNDHDASDRALAYLETHRKDSLNTYQIALLEANRLDDATAFLISRLRDPDQRTEALCEVQDYSPYYDLSAQYPARVRLRLERWQTIKKRADVQEEIAKVGKIERFSLMPPI